MPPGPDDPVWKHARRRSSRRRTYLPGGGVAAAAVTAAVVAGLLVFLPSGSLLAHAGGGQPSPGDGTPTTPAPFTAAPEPSTPAPAPTGLQGSRSTTLRAVLRRAGRADGVIFPVRNALAIVPAV
jgi:hypothetical protein